MTTSTIKIVALAAAAATDLEAIQLCADHLQELGDVGPSFGPSCISREQENPTGLLSTIPVAIPHARSDAIYHDAVCYLRLDEPVSFHRMDDDEQTVQTRSVFSLAISGGEHMKFLSRMIRLVMDSALIEQLEAMDIAEAPAFIDKCIAEKGITK